MTRDTQPIIDHMFGCGNQLERFGIVNLTLMGYMNSSRRFVVSYSASDLSTEGVSHVGYNIPWLLNSPSIKGCHY